MAFNSFSFWLVFPFVFCFYWLIPIRCVRLRKWYLILVSYLLYMNWKPAFALVLSGVTFTTYYGALFVERSRNRNVLAGLFALIALFPLLVFKYYGFLNSTLTDILAFCGLRFELPGLNWAVPVGISFFTFQSVGYLMDVHYRRIEAEHSLSDYFLFVSFFPQIASGPISKACELLPQIRHPHPFCRAQSVAGLKLLLWGMFLKLAVADRLGLYVNEVYANYEHYSGAVCLLSAFFYAMQIYADFCGYSLMAVGIGKLLGFDLVNNFRRPYFSVSVTDFWRRWHISLSRWLRDYVYIPLGGSRCSKARCYWNIFVTFLVSGIWHGANWTFIVWGMMHGAAQVLEKMLGMQRCEDKNAFVRSVRMAFTFLLVCVAWVFFRMDTIDDACGFLAHTVGHFSDGLVLTHQRMSILATLPILLFKDFRDEFFPQRLAILRTRLVRRALYLLLFLLIIAVGVLDSGQFIYVNF